MEEKKKTDLHNYIQLISAVVIIAAVVLVIVFVISPMIKYSNATAALDKGEYEKAITLFDELGNYRDSADMKNQAELLFNYSQGSEEETVTAEDMENSYLRAKSLLENGKYDKAASILRLLGNYKDSATLLEPIKYYGLEAGTEITLGTWEQDCDKTNGAEPITWIVVSTEQDCVVLMSEKILDYKAYSDSGSSGWSGSTVRSFLAGDFYENAFTAEEKKLLLTKTTTTEDNPEYETSGGSDCKDTVFLPSIQEYSTYILQIGDKKTGVATEYAKALGLYEYNYTKSNKEYKGSWFWLRSSGFANGYAAVCYSDGEISYGGQLTNIKLGVRPFIRIALVEPEE